MRIIVSAIAIALAFCACERAPMTAAQPAKPAPASAAAAAGSEPASAPTAAQPAKPDAMSATDPVAINDAVVDKAIDEVLGDHVRYRATFDAFKQAVAAADAPAVAALVGYPFKTTIDGRKTTIADAGAFAKQYDKIFTTRITRVVAQQEYRGLFVSGKGVMFGRGEVWLNGICEDGGCKSPNVRVVAIQPTER